MLYWSVTSSGWYSGESGMYSLIRSKPDALNSAIFKIYVVPTGMEEAPKAALNIHCLQLGGGAALTRMINLIPPLRGDGGARA